MSEQFPVIDFNDNTLIRIIRVRQALELNGFTSDIDEFNTYIGPEMTFDLEHNITKVYRIEIAGIVADYFDLAMAHIRPDATPEIIKKGIESNVPALLISRLAVDKIFQGYGVGTKLIYIILKDLVPKLKKLTGVRYLMLNPRNDEGVRIFYEKLGFTYIERLVDGGPTDREQDAFLFDLIDVEEESEII